MKGIYTTVKSDLVYETFNKVYLLIGSLLGINIWEDWSWSVDKVVLAILVILFGHIANIKKEVRVYSDRIVKGLRIPYYSELQKTITIYKQEYKGLFLVQDEDRYFCILAQGKDETKILLHKHPNRNPAQEEMKKLEEKLEEGFEGVYKGSQN